MGFVSHPLLKPNKIQARLYQELLVARIVEKGNTLVVAPTALGKTVVAAMAAAHILKKGGKLLFMAPTKPLAAQHYQSFKEMTNIEPLALFTGETKTGERAQLWKDAKAIFATPQTIESALFAGQIKFEDVALLVFDEAHRAMGDYAYVYLADRYVKRRKQPHILALTASPGGTREKIQDICKNLYIQNIEVKNEEDEDVRPYVQEKNVEWVELVLPVEYAEVKVLLEDVMKHTLAQLKELGFAKNTSLRWYNRMNLLKMQQYLLRVKRKEPKAFQGLSEVAALMKLYHAHELLETQGIDQLQEYFEKMSKEETKASKRIVSYMKIQKARAITEKLVRERVMHPKQEKLLEVLGDGQSIVFTHYRTTAKKVEAFLNENGFKAVRFIGQSTKEGEKGLRQKEQLEIIQKFRDKEFDVLVCTSVGEEGLDIPNVDQVVFYEPVATEIRKIQRAGRTGRHKPGKVVILITKDTRDEAYYWSSKKREKEMKKVLVGMQNGEISEPQKTLTEFAGIKRGDAPTIYVDNRERASGITKRLMDKEVHIKPYQLKVGDFLLSERCVVERKEVNDFVSSMISGRLFEQAAELRRNFACPIIVIEGENLYEARNVHPNTIRGALGALAVDYGIPILNTRDVDDTADLLVVLAKREQVDEQKVVRLRGEKRAMSDADQQVFIVESLPGVGGTLARDILAHFGSVEKVFAAGDKELREVGKVGPKKAKEVRRILTKKYAK